MAVIKVSATTLALDPRGPERMCTVIAKGDADSIHSIESDPDWVADMLSRLVVRNGYLMMPSMYMPAPGTMLNFIGMVNYLWEDYKDNLEMECEGDIGTISYEKGKVY